MKHFLTILISLLVAVGIYAQSDSTLNAQVPQIEYSLTHKKYNIADIKVKGADNYEDFVLIGFSGLAVGEKIEVPGKEITDAVRRFWKQGVFSDVKILADKIQGDSIWLTIYLHEHRRVSSITYNGVRKSEIEDLEPKVGISKGSQITPNLKDRAVTVVKKYLAEKGFHNADVLVIERDDLARKGYVNVVIDISKNAKTKINAIRITGNEAMSFNQINHVMKKTNDNSILNLFRKRNLYVRNTKKTKLHLLRNIMNLAIAMHI